MTKLSWLVQLWTQSRKFTSSPSNLVLEGSYLFAARDSLSLANLWNLWADSITQFCLLPWSDGPPNTRECPAWQSVTCPMNDEEVKSGQKEGPACLPVIQVLGHPEVHEAPMVIQDLYCASSSLQDVPPFFQIPDG